jgi:hypothetical protein
VCPTCGQSINTPEHIEKRKIEVEELTSDISDLTNKFTNLSVSNKNREEAEAKTNKKLTRKFISIINWLWNPRGRNRYS